MNPRSPLGHSQYIILSAAHSLGTETHNAQQHIKLGEALASRGMFVTETMGQWQGQREFGYAVRLDEPDDYDTVMRLAKRFEQEAVLYIAGGKGFVIATATKSDIARTRLELEFLPHPPRDGSDYTEFKGLVGPVFMAGREHSISN